MLAHKSLPAQDFMGVNKVDDRESKNQPDWRLVCGCLAKYIVQDIEFSTLPIHGYIKSFQQLNLPKTKNKEKKVR